MVKQKILITGGAGFIGSHLVKAFSFDEKFNVTVLDRNINRHSFFKYEKLLKQSRYVKIDLKRKRKLNNFLEKNKFNLIIHLAAESIVENSYASPVNALENNINGTINLLEAVRQFQPNCQIIVASSDKAYGTKVKPYCETDALKGNRPYEVSKSCQDLIAQMYARTYQTKIVITRCANVYGEGDFHFSRLIPSIIRSIIFNEKLILRSDGTFRRDYLYVGDLIEAYKKIVYNFEKIKGEPLNISSGENLSVEEVIKIFEKAIIRKIDYQIGKVNINEIHSQSLNFDKIERLTDWHPKITMRLVAAKIYDYYRQKIYHGKMQKLSR